jgi:Tol biopolymer transport system component
MRRLGLGVLLAMVATAVFASPASAAFPGRNGPIAAVLIPAGIPGYDPLVSIRPDGSGLRRLTAAGVSVENSATSPNGRWIVFNKFIGADTAELWLMRSNGTDRHRITSVGGRNLDPSWSPGGRWIIFAHAATNARADLWVVRPDGAHPHFLLATANRDDGNPEYSPNGRSIAFTANVDLNSASVMLAHSNGADQQVLVAESTAQSGVSWAPNGRWLAFAGGPPTGSSIFAIRPNGLRLKQLTGRGAQPPFDTSPSWSPNGRQIAFSRTACTTPACLAISELIDVMRANGTHQRSLGHASAGSFLSPSWAPAPSS